MSRVPWRVTCGEDGRYVIEREAHGEVQRIDSISEEELRWLGIVVIPAALPPLLTPVQRDARSSSG